MFRLRSMFIFLPLRRCMYLTWFGVTNFEAIPNTFYRLKLYWNNNCIIVYTNKMTVFSLFRFIFSYSFLMNVRRPPQINPAYVCLIRRWRLPGKTHHPVLRQISQRNHSQLVRQVSLCSYVPVHLLDYDKKFSGPGFAAMLTPSNINNSLGDKMWLREFYISLILDHP